MARPSPRRRGRLQTGRLIGRALSLAAFLPVASRAPMYARLVYALVRDERVPFRHKAVLAGAAGYLMLGQDLVPDDIPIIGGLDDLIVVVLAVEVFLAGIPDDLLAEKLGDLGIEAAAFDRDVARIRRLIPGPVRRLLREVPRMVDGAAAAIERSGIGPAIRGRTFGTSTG